MVTQVTASTRGGPQPAAATPPPTLDNCEREPIHLPGAIQPHGALLAFEPASGALLFASANLDRFLPVGPMPAFGRLLQDLLGDDGHALVLRALENTAGAAVRHQIVDLPARPAQGQPLALQVVLHRYKGLCIAEFEPAGADDRDWLQLLGDAVDALRGAADLGELADTAARRVRRLIGFDRVMVYRFDAEWNGRVIADAREPEMESYLDLHYPASDIPAQARELYRVNLVRYIADVAYEPVAVQPWRAPMSSEPLDMSHAMLRSVSPMHLQYLHNMGVRSTLTISLVVDGRLWGLIAAHHRTPTALPLRLRRACHALSVTAGYMVGWTLQRERAEAVARHLRHQSRIVDAFNQVQAPMSAVVENCAGALLQIAGASGGAIWRGTDFVPFGQWPGGERSASILQFVRQHFERSGDDLYAVDKAPLVPPLADAELGTVSGLLALKLDPSGSAGIAWLRPEWRREVDWGGDPEQPAQVQLDAAGQPLLTPRSSFARWTVLLRGRARPWSEVDLEAVRALLPLREVLVVRDSLAQVSLGERRFRSLLSLQADAYWQTDLLGRLIALSKPMPGMAATVQGKTFADLLQASCDAAALAPLRDALAASEPFRDLRVRGRAVDGDEFELNLNGEPMRDREGRIIGWHGTITDLTHERAMQVAVRQRESAELANLAKSRFMSQISHELRTPLNAIIGFSHLLLKGDELTPAQRARLGHIQKAGDWLLTMISDLLDLSRIETGNLALAPAAVDVQALLRDSADLVQAQAESAGLTLEVDAGGRALHAWADAQRLKQVLVNLASNAVKYNRAGGRVRLALRDDPQDAARLRIEVHDTGEGLSATQVEQLFQAFNRLGREGQQIQGTGIGLVIAKRLVEAMGGRIEVTSEPGVGSCFAVVLRRAAPAEGVPPGTAPGAAGDAAPARPLVLYVEDAPVNVELMRALVEAACDARFAHADTAEGGLRLLQAERPAVVLVDLNLPGEPGTWLAERLRADPALDAAHCIAVTADATPEATARARAAGFDDVWTKPLDLQGVSARLPRLLARRRGGRAAARIGFDDLDALDRLEAASDEDLDQVALGVVRLNEMGVVTAYNRCEAEHAGLAPERVIGRRFFEEVARCADNALVAGRLRDEPELDATLDYVFTFRLRTTPVRLRLLRSARARHRYLLVDRG